MLSVRKAGSALMALLLAFTMCVPAMSISLLNSPERAVAAENGLPDYVSVHLDEDNPVFESKDLGIKIELKSNSGVMNWILENPGDYRPKTEFSPLDFQVRAYGERIEIKSNDGSETTRFKNTGGTSYPTYPSDLSTQPEASSSGILNACLETVPVVDYNPPADILATGELDPDFLMKPVVFQAFQIRQVTDPNDYRQIYKANYLYITQLPQPRVRLVTPDATALSASDVTSEQGVSYSVFKIFDADVDGKYSDAEAPKVSNIAFATGITGDLIKGTSDDPRDFTNAQNAAEFVSENIAHQPGVDLESNTYGMELAKRLMNAGITPTAVTADAENLIRLNGEGYYLIIKTDDLTGESTAATSPIYVALDSGDNVIELKTAIPTVKKEVQEDSDDSWGIVADASNGQVVNYKLTGTVAENVKSFDTYSYKFVDTLEADKLTLDEDSIAITVDGKDVKAQATIAYADNVLNISFADLKNLTDGADKIAITPDTEVIVTYSAALNDASDIAGDGNQNDVYIEYSNNPMTDSKGTTKVDSARVYTYALDIEKVDNATNDPLAGVTFTVKNSAGKFIALDGTEHDDEQILTTDAQGRITITRVDADTYTATEVTPLDHYAPFTGTAKMVITPTYSDVDGDSLAFDLEAVNGDLTEDAHVAPGIVALDGLDGDVINPDTKYAQMTIFNVKWVDMPTTGDNGVWLGIIAGLVLLSAATAETIRRKRANQA